MKKSTFKISQMDCPSEEALIRMKLENIEAVIGLNFDIPNRTLRVYHNDNIKTISKELASLQLGDKLISSAETQEYSIDVDNNQKKLLWIVLAINLGFFFIESITGFIANSMGLVADSLDMLADAFVYGISLMAVGRSVSRKKNIAKTAGYFQIALAVLGFTEILRRFFGNESLPAFQTMITVSILALTANAVCLLLLQKSKSKEEAHMQASMVFTSNDIIINLGVIIAGVLVYLTNTRFPDLVVGTIVFILVLQGAVRILKLSK